MLCSNCEQQNNEGAKFCSNCGRSMTASRKKKSKKRNFLYIFILLFLLSGTGFAAAQFMGDEPETAAPPVEEPAVEEEEEEEEAVEEQDLEAEPEVFHEEVDETPVPAGTVTKEITEIEEPIQTEPKKKEKTTIIKEAQHKVYTIFTESSLGSGFQYTNDGMVVTNAHVVAGYTDVTVRNINGLDEPGKVIGISDVYDIALIQVDAFAGIDPLPIEDKGSDVGTEVIALGSPSGFENTATMGYLTGIDRDFAVDFLYENIYQIDAKIEPGNSGGPLLDAGTGNVIGINSLLYTDDTSIAFAIPMYSVTQQLTEWANNPMSEDEVNALFSGFDVYDEFETESPDFEYNPDNGFDVGILGEFIGNFRYYYELALSNEDFYYIEDMLLRDSEIYNGIDEYITDISGQGMEFNFTDLEITDTEIHDGYALVYTYEAFDFKNAAGDWTVEERKKMYTVQMDEFGFYVISDIVIQ